ncbi:hypothetical protein O7614_07200 [Micromonospora sp. WMMD961]|uniref:hypothetical protein n=1 Tax=Micromonospora sp. WMMD961 TaxID=3016100 RepID=UPI0024163F5B|nr:hypothetical protein [Micromonospora sp. WMMD961]MDG4779432.1 hypothetical protein [Micromonospora sp. WMMD961]
MNHLSAPRRLLAWAVPATLALAVVAPALPAQAAPADTPTSAATGPVDKDLNGDGVPDLVTAGGPTTGLDSGVWAARGRVGATTGVGTGRVKVPAVNIGIYGTGVTGNDDPAADFDGAQVITGRFFGTANQDFLAYYPSGVNAGGGSFIAGTGDGTMAKPNGGSAQVTLIREYLLDEHGNSPIQLVNGFTADGADTGIPDLLGIVGDASNGYRLAYYPNYWATSLYLPLPQGNATPTGGSDWQNWTLASTELTSGMALVLRNATTGDLYLWQGVTMTDNGDGTGTLSYTQYRLASGWNTGAAISSLIAADLNADGVADLWAVFPDGSVRAYLISNLSTTKPARVRAVQAQQLN